MSWFKSYSSNTGIDAGGASRASTTLYQNQIRSWINDTRSRFSGYESLLGGLESSMSGMSDMQLYAMAEGVRVHIAEKGARKQPVHYYVPIKEGNSFKYVDFGYTLRNPERYRGQLIVENIGNGMQAFIVGDDKMPTTFFGRQELYEPLKSNRFDPDVRISG